MLWKIPGNVLDSGRFRRMLSVVSDGSVVVAGSKRFFSNVFLLNLNFQSVSHPISHISQHQILFIMADRCVVETENLKKVLNAISKIKKKKEG